MNTDPMVKALIDALDAMQPHVKPWNELLHAHAAGLPDDVPQSPEEDGCFEKSYATHEARAFTRDMFVLLEARQKLEYHFPIMHGGSRR